MRTVGCWIILIPLRETILANSKTMDSLMLRVSLLATNFILKSRHQLELSFEEVLEKWIPIRLDLKSSLVLWSWKIFFLLWNTLSSLIVEYNAFSLWNTISSHCEELSSYCKILSSHCKILSSHCEILFLTVKYCLFIVKYTVISSWEGFFSCRRMSSDCEILLSSRKIFFSLRNTLSSHREVLSSHCELLSPDPFHGEVHCLLIVKNCLLIVKGFLLTEKYTSPYDRLSSHCLGKPQNVGKLLGKACLQGRLGSCGLKFAREVPPLLFQSHLTFLHSRLQNKLDSHAHPATLSSLPSCVMDASVSRTEYSLSRLLPWSPRLGTARGQRISVIDFSTSIKVDYWILIVTGRRLWILIYCTSVSEVVL